MPTKLDAKRYGYVKKFRPRWDSNPQSSDDFIPFLLKEDSEVGRRIHWATRPVDSKGVKFTILTGLSYCLHTMHFTGVVFISFNIPTSLTTQAAAASRAVN